MSIEKRIIAKAKKNLRLIVLPEAGREQRVLDGGLLAASEGIAKIILIGGEDLKKHENTNIKVIVPSVYENKKTLINTLYEKRAAKGMTQEEAAKLIENDTIMFGTMLVECGYADGMVAGAITKTADVLRPALQIIKAAPGVSVVSAAHLMSGKTINNKEHCLLFSDCALNIEPTAEQLADIAISTAESARTICGIEPVVAFLSFATCGKAQTEECKKIAEALEILRTRKVDFAFDGPLQADTALDPGVAKIKAPNCAIGGTANCLIFPNLMAGNIGYKLFQRGSGGVISAIGPFTQGLNKPINDLSRGCNVDEIVDTIAITAIQKN